MAFISNSELQALHDENATMRTELQEWRRMAPFLELGKELQDELVGTLGTLAVTGASADEIGKAAYDSVKSKKEDEAREKLTTQYEQAHRKALYERVVQEVEQTEGQDILADVFARLESDAKLAKELRDSARTELTARAHDVVLASVTEEQKVVIEAETSRQIALDKFDVEFALCGEIDLAAPGIAELLTPNDKLIIKFAKHDPGQSGMEFVWAEDINGQTGWVYSQALDPKSNSHYKSVRVKDTGIPKDRFVRLGAQLPDLTKGTVGTKQDELIEKRPLTITWTDDKGATQTYVIKETVKVDNYTSEVVEAKVCATDFQTKDIVFVNSRQKK